MYPAPFEYYAPNTIAEALSLLSQHGADAVCGPRANGLRRVTVLNRFSLEMKLEIHGRTRQNARSEAVAIGGQFAAEQCPSAGDYGAAFPLAPRYLR